MPAKTKSESSSKSSLVVLVGRIRAAGQDHLRDRVFLGVFSDRTVVLSFHRDRYFFLLDAEHQAVCEMLPIRSTQPVVLPVVCDSLPAAFGEFLSQELGLQTATLVAYDYRRQNAARGLDAFNWQERFGLIMQGLQCPAKSIARKPPFMDFLRIYLKLVVFGLFCRIGRTRPIVAGFIKAPGRGITHEDVTAEIVRCINRCLPFVPFKIECLAYAAALGSILRAKGIDASLVIGVRSVPFEAHAWTEVEGVVVGERDGLRHELSVIFDTRCALAHTRVA